MDLAKKSQLFVCKECDASFKYSYTLSRHRKNKHQIIAVKPPISVPECIQSFEKQDCCLNVKKKNLNRHLRAVHGFTETQISNMSLNLKSNILLHPKPSANLKPSEPKKAMVYTSSNIALMEQIPDGYNYNILTKKNLSDGKFIAKFEILNFDVSDVTNWMLEMRRKCKTTYLSTNCKKPDSVVFKKRYRCHHNTRPKKNSVPRAKHLSCVATLIIQIEHTFDEIAPYDKPTSKAVVVMRHIHNHKLMCADVLKYRIPSDEVKEQILKLFEEGKSPSKALLTLKKQLYVDKGSNYYVCAGDRGELPDPEWVYYQYYKTFKKHFGSSHGDAMMISLKDAVDEYNRDCNYECSSMEILDDGNFIIAILSPLMRRISEGFDESGEVLFIDSSGNVDRYGCKVFFIYTNSCAGGMLVGSLIVTSEATSIIVKGLELWKKMLSPESLGKRGQIGPRIFMTDDSLAERNALREVFPQTTLLLCIFHVLQAAWRYLWDSNHGIPLKHRPSLFSGIKNMIYSKDTDELNNSFNLINQNPITNDYPRFKVYVEGLFKRRQEWAICLRNNLVTRGQNTNNISEAGVKIMKDVVLERTKAYSPVQLFFFIINDLDKFYEMKILDVAANRPPQYLKKKYFISAKQKKSLEYKALNLGKSLFVVKNKIKNTMYNVDTDTGLCSCPQGDTGKPCKHQIYVAKDLNIDIPLCLPSNEHTRIKLHTIATGCSDIKKDWYTPFLNTENNENTELCVEPKIQNNIIVEPSHSLNISENQSSPIQISPTYNEVLEKFDSTVDKIKRAFESDREYFLPGINAFVNSFDKNVNTHAALLSAMMTFGKYSGINPKSIKPKLIGNKHIGTQPTARGRRVTQIGGRHNLTSGRVPKWKRVNEHGYHFKLTSSQLPRGNIKSFDPSVVPKKVSKMPHQLSYCVDKNKPLGSTHNAK